MPRGKRLAVAQACRRLKAHRMEWERIIGFFGPKIPAVPVQ